MSTTIQLKAKASGCLIYQIGNTLSVKKQPAAWLPTALFVIGLLTFIPCTAGVVFILSADLQTPGLILIGTGCVFAFVFFLLVKHRRKLTKIPPAELTTLCIFDFDRGQLMDGSGKSLAELTAVQLERKYQMSSSSKKLLVSWPGGSIVLAKGNPFAGGIAPLEAVFRAHNLI